MRTSKTVASLRILRRLVWVFVVHYCNYLDYIKKHVANGEDLDQTVVAKHILVFAVCGWKKCSFSPRTASFILLSITFSVMFTFQSWQSRREYTGRI